MSSHFIQPAFQGGVDYVADAEARREEAEIAEAEAAKAAQIERERAAEQFAKVAGVLATIGVCAAVAVFGWMFATNAFDAFEVY